MRTEEQQAPAQPSLVECLRNADWNALVHDTMQTGLSVLNRDEAIREGSHWVGIFTRLLQARMNEAGADFETRVVMIGVNIIWAHLRTLEAELRTLGIPVRDCQEQITGAISSLVEQCAALSQHDFFAIEDRFPGVRGTESVFHITPSVAGEPVSIAPDPLVLQACREQRGRIDPRHCGASSTMHEITDALVRVYIQAKGLQERLAAHEPIPAPERSHLEAYRNLFRQKAATRCG